MSSPWDLGECLAFSFCLQLDSWFFVPLLLQRPFTCLTPVLFVSSLKGKGGSGLNLCGSFACEISMSFQKWWQQPRSPGPTGLVQGSFNSPKAVAWSAVAGLAHKLEVSLCFRRARSEDGGVFGSS